MRRGLRILGIAGGLWLFLPACAEAHLVNTGFGPFYNGLCHPFINPLDLLSVFALALLAGHAGPARGRSTLFSLTLAWMLGTVVGYTWQESVWSAPVIASASVVLCIAILGAANIRCPLPVLSAFALAVGVLFGLSNGGEFASLQEPPSALLGVVTTVFALMTWLTALAVKHNHGWRRILARVLESWIAAASLLVIGWELRDVLAS